MRRTKGTRNSESGVYIIGEGLTEQFYFKHLKSVRNYNCQVQPGLFKNNSYYKLEKSISIYLKVASFIICVYDMDVAERNEKARNQLQKLMNEYGGNEKVLLCPSLPCIEYWFLLHYNQIGRKLNNKEAVMAELRKYIPDYDTMESFLKNEKWVRDMSSDDKLKKAIDFAKKLDKKDNSYSDLYKAIEKLDESFKTE